jgi:hypothetical protein
VATRSRLLAGAFALALAALALTGCTTQHAARSERLYPASAPKIGACWAASVETIETTSTWTGGSSIPCTQRHDLFTYGTMVLPGTFTGGQYDSDDYLKPEIAAAADWACQIVQRARFASAETQELRTAYSFFLPSASAWKAGARWVRCDLSLLTFGTPLSKPHFDALPADSSTFLTGIDHASKHYQLCINTSETASDDSDPLNAKSARYADCSAKPQWRATAMKQFPTGVTLAFPGTDALDSVATDICGLENTDRVIVYYEPDKDSWASGDRLLDCWQADGSRTDSGGANA